MLSLLIAAAALASAEDVPAAVRKAAELHGKDDAGYIGWQAEAAMALEGPFGTKASTWRAWIVAKDGQPVETRLIALVSDGKPVGDAERAKMQERFNDPKGRKKNQVFWPIDPAHVADYAFTPGAAGSFTFKAKLRDAHHGDGTLELAKDGHAKRVTYVPAQLPPRASSADLVIELAPVGADWHAAVRSRSRFAGGIGPLKGGMSIDQKQAGHQRFKSLEAARAAAPD
jgi:hypothetical protein